jgi:hypothetical protein
MAALTPATSVSAPVVFPIHQIGADVAVYISDAEILVTSQSHPDGMRLVNLIDGTCTCEAGAHQLPSCHHRVTAKIAAELERSNATPVAPKSCACGQQATAEIDGEPYCPECAPSVAECETCGEVRFIARVNCGSYGRMSICAQCAGRDEREFRQEN